MSFAGYACDRCATSLGPEDVVYGCPSGCGNVFVRVDLERAPVFVILIGPPRPS